MRDNFSNFIKIKYYTIKNALKRIFFYRQSDLEEYWRARASYPLRDSRLVFWANIYYNRCFREREFRIIKQLIENHNISKGHVLDIGCGPGEVSNFLAELGFQQIDAIDFPEMIKLAKEINSNPRINYIPCPAQSYKVNKTYDLIISSGALSMIIDIPQLFKAIDNCVVMLRKGGYILLIDPFHKSNLLARARISADEIITYLEKKGLRLIKRDGMLFWPVRILISSDTSLTEYQTRVLFKVGEKMLATMGKICGATIKYCYLRSRVTYQLI